MPPFLQLTPSEQQMQHASHSLTETLTAIVHDVHSLHERIRQQHGRPSRRKPFFPESSTYITDAGAGICRRKSLRRPNILQSTTMQGQPVTAKASKAVTKQKLAANVQHFWDMNNCMFLHSFSLCNRRRSMQLQLQQEQQLAAAVALIVRRRRP